MNPKKEHLLNYDRFISPLKAENEILLQPLMFIGGRGVERQFYSGGPSGAALTKKGIIVKKVVVVPLCMERPAVFG